MKKLISIILSLALVACMFAMNVGAVHVVGSHGGGNINDGVEDIPANSVTSAVINLNLGTIKHRYAVDVTFEDMALNVGDVTWNVNTAKYELANANHTPSWNITVANYSDMPVIATAALAEQNLQGGLTVAFDKNTLKLDSVTIGDTDGVSDTMVVNASSTDWNATINEYMKNGLTNNVTIAKITVTISKPVQP